MKNITVTVPDEVYRQARVHAAEQGSSVSALVAEFLRDVATQDRFSELEKLQREVLDGIRTFRAGDRVSRSELHDRAVR